MVRKAVIFMSLVVSFVTMVGCSNAPNSVVSEEEQLFVIESSIENVENISDDKSILEVSEIQSSVIETESKEVSELKIPATYGQREALKKLRSMLSDNYIFYVSMEYKGLIDYMSSLVNDDNNAIYAVDNCGVDWNDRALKYAKSISYVPTYNELFKSLESKFSSEQAKYGAENCGFDWNEKAADRAKKYLSNMKISREDLIEQLEFDGFTYEQAIYGVTANGY